MSEWSIWDSLWLSALVTASAFFSSATVLIVHDLWRKLRRGRR